jgi:hypothetical protein
VDEEPAADDPDVPVLVAPAESPDCRQPLTVTF